jgi:hypothetical protein
VGVLDDVGDLVGVAVVVFRGVGVAITVGRLVEVYVGITVGATVAV